MGQAAARYVCGMCIREHLRASTAPAAGQQALDAPHTHYVEARAWLGATAPLFFFVTVISGSGSKFEEETDGRSRPSSLVQDNAAWVASSATKAMKNRQKLSTDGRRRCCGTTTDE